MLALDLQFSRLDDVIHFSLTPPTLPQSNRPMEEKSALGMQIFWLRCSHCRVEHRHREVVAIWTG
jgi:hypothetical protein